MLELAAPLKAVFEGDDAFDRILLLEGEVYRHVKGRRTLRFMVENRGYFLKAHSGVGWTEILKNLFFLRLPVLGAENERRAIEAFERVGVETMVIAGFGVRGLCPASRQSFLITEELENTVSLEEFCRSWSKSPPPYLLRKAMVEKLADIARRLHRNGINHRDFYLCHFLLRIPLPLEVKSPADLHIFVIDLHRVQIRSTTPRRWAAKDIAGLYFSALDAVVTRRDVWRFMCCYSGRSLRDTLATDRSFWFRVRSRAAQIYRRDFHREPEMPV